MGWGGAQRTHGMHAHTEVGSSRSLAFSTELGKNDDDECREEAREGEEEEEDEGTWVEIEVEGDGDRGDGVARDVWRGEYVR